MYGSIYDVPFTPECVIAWKPKIVAVIVIVAVGSSIHFPTYVLISGFAAAIWASNVDASYILKLCISPCGFGKLKITLETAVALLVGAIASLVLIDDKFRS